MPKKIEYKEVGEQYWVTSQVGYVQVVRLSPSGNGTPYKGKDRAQGYMILHRDKPGDEPTADLVNSFLTLDEMFARMEELANEQQAALDAMVKDLPFKKILELGPVIQAEIQNAINQFGWEKDSDLTVEVTLEKNLELMVRIGLA